MSKERRRVGRKEEKERPGEAEETTGSKEER
jgi:hypothetical protein